MPNVRKRQFIDKGAVEADDDEDLDEAFLRDEDPAHQQAEEQELAKAERDALERRGRDGGVRRLYGEDHLRELEEAAKKADEMAELLGDSRPLFSSTTQTHKPAPTVNDPRIWLIKTMSAGREREMSISIANKANAMIERGVDPPVFSVFASEHLKGYLYLEGDNEAAIVEFTRGIRSLCHWDLKIVPINEMAQVFDSAEKANVDHSATLHSGDWVRLKAKHRDYGLDLAQVVREEERMPDYYVVRVRPRLADLRENPKGSESWLPNVGSKRTGVRPEPALFDDVSQEKAGSISAVIREGAGLGPGQVQWKQYTFQDGYLLLSLNRNYFITGASVKPTLKEFVEFGVELDQAHRAAEHTLQNDVASAPLPGKVEKHFVPGDRVIIIKGQNINLRGAVFNVREDTVQVRPAVEAAQRHQFKALDTIDFHESEIRKLFRIGDHIRVAHGSFAGTSGMITSIVDSKDGSTGVAVVFDKITKRSLEVKLDDCHVDIAPTEIVVGKTTSIPTPYRIGHTVHCLSGVSGGYGLVIRIEPGPVFAVLSPSNQIVVLSTSELGGIRQPGKHAAAKSAGGDVVGAGARVKVRRGEHQGRVAQVVSVVSNTLFIKFFDVLVRGGFYAIGADATDRVDQRETWEKEGEAGTRKQAVDMARAGEKVIGEQGMITKGPYKGVRALIRNVMGNDFRVMLLTKPKSMVISKHHFVMESNDPMKLQGAQVFESMDAKPLPVATGPGFQDLGAVATPGSSAHGYQSVSTRMGDWHTKGTKRERDDETDIAGSVKSDDQGSTKTAEKYQKYTAGGARYTLSDFGSPVSGDEK
mmetsp:Transcript_41531/g.90478  ORF Transcript_41531/g.90478 Transcript_41531/m.90478 type:complete len:814 (-) Transcript_41531:29-2470(-)